jgi:hypothetical protein
MTRAAASWVSHPATSSGPLGRATRICGPDHEDDTVLQGYVALSSV